MNCRGILSNVTIVPNGRAVATLVSEDFCAGEVDRYPLTQGGIVTTSTVLAIDLVEGQLILKTENSSYIVEGSITTEDGVRHAIKLAKDKANA